MKFNLKLTLLIVLVAALVIIPFIMANKEKQPSTEDVLVNHDVTTMQSFSVDSSTSELNTVASGTVFVEVDEQLTSKIRVFATVEIDPLDWGGVAFYIPSGWDVANVYSSYLGGAEDSVAVWTSVDNKWQTMIEIGRNRNYEAGEGGSGTVVIDLVANGQLANKINIAVEVGSADKDGTKIMGTDFIEVPITLMKE